MSGVRPDRWQARRRRGEARASELQDGGDPYNRGVNASMTPAAGARNLSLSTTPSVGLPTGLTVADATRIAEAMNAAHAQSTRDTYAHAWRVWERWCAARDATPMAACPAMVCAYLTERADQGFSVGTLDLACSAIAYQHRRHGLENPILNESVRQVRRGLRRIVGTAPRRQARPPGVAEIRRILGAINARPPWALATPPSSCSDSPRPCAAPN